MSRIGIALFFTAMLLASFQSPADKGRGLPNGEVQVHSIGVAASNNNRQPAGVGYPSLMSPHATPIASIGKRVFVVNTPADTVDVIDASSRRIVDRISVGIDPVGMAVRPDGKELWVSNHVSDSVSVIDIELGSPTCLTVVATVQDLDPKTRATRFDEPVGIAFASNEKAYVALSSENEIAVVNVMTRKVEKKLSITAQDPRAITVRGDRLYVIPFESNNKTQLSGGKAADIDGDLVTFDAWDHSIANNNVLSLGHVVDIVKNPKVPDRDLYVFDTRTDRLIETVDTLGTLLYGLTVDSTGRVYIAQTDARNDVNGRSGTKKHGLAELENRAFLNQITAIQFQDDTPQKPEFIDLEPLPPLHPGPGEAFATPFAIEVSDDDSTLVVTAAGSDKLLTVDPVGGEVLGEVKVDAVPRGIALESTAEGRPSQAWVLNSIANTVSLVDLSNTVSPKLVTSISLEDPTHAAFKRGRIAFNTAAASTTGTFSCASCHPDGHTDQLLWVLKTPIVTGGKQIMPRSTMPIRGLRDTAPYHWDGVPGDPYGGNNSANIYGHVKPNSRVDQPESSTRHLIDGGLASTMSQVGDSSKNDEGKAGLLSAVDRDDMAKFLLNVMFPPAQRRSYTDQLSSKARAGFELFHVKGDLDGKPRPNVCGDCHRMPFLVSTNTPGTGMDAPTWRGAYDRWLILPQGRLNIIDFGFFHRIAEKGIPEQKMWQFSWGGRRRFDPVWEMVLEGSTGFSGSFGRQVTLTEQTAQEKWKDDLLDALEVSAAEGSVVLQTEGLFIHDAASTAVTMQFQVEDDKGVYVELNGGLKSYSRDELVAAAAKGDFIGTFTARHGIHADLESPQPAVWTRGSLQRQAGRQIFPILYGDQTTMKLSGRHFTEDARLVVDGRRTSGSIQLEDGEKVSIKLDSLPDTGMHFLQVQNPNGLFSNDFIFYVAENREKSKQLRLEMDPSRSSAALFDAISRGDLAATKRLVGIGASLRTRRSEDGMTPMSTAIYHGKNEIANYLRNKGASISRSNRDGNTPLHIAAFLCREEMVEWLLELGASVEKKNSQGESVIDVVSGAWSSELMRFYKLLSDRSKLELDLGDLKESRPLIAEILRTRISKK